MMSIPANGYLLYLPHPVQSNWAIVRAAPDSRMHLLGADAQKDRRWELSEPVMLYKAVGLSTRPDETLLARSRQWLKEHRDDDNYKIRPFDRVADVFPEGPTRRDEVDILIVDEEIIEGLDEYPGYRSTLKQRDKNLTRISMMNSPSTGVENFQGIRDVLDQHNDVFHTGRPHDNYGPPVALFHPTLGLLAYHLHHLEDSIPEIEPDHNEIFQTHGFIQQSLSTFRDEDRQVEMMKVYLPVLLGSPLRWKAKFHGIQPDFVIGVNPWVVGELKNETGLVGDASLQAALSYSKIITSNTPETATWRAHSNNPAILIGLMGDLLEFSIAVCTDSVYVDRQFSQRLRLDYYQDTVVLRVARAFKAVKLASTKLQAFYAAINRHSIPTIAHLFPSPVVSPSCNMVMPHLVFKSRIYVTGELYAIVDLENENKVHMRQSKLYLATMIGANDSLGSLEVSASNIASTFSGEGNGVEVIVKFTTQYHAEAHRILSSARLAPTLHACIPVCDQLYMVIMDRVHGKTAWSFTRNPPLPDGIHEDIKTAITLLHSNGLVFGDLR